MEIWQLEEILERAEARLINPVGPGGVHYELMAALGQLGYRPKGREEAIKLARDLVYGDEALEYYLVMGDEKWKSQ